jgi:uncharacterized beta-barrel protein YwiB (DUF1934 family)
MKKILFILILLISSLQLNFAYDGNWLYYKGLEDKKLNEGLRGNYFDSALFCGYISGIVDTWNGLLFCPPSHVTNGQIYDIVFKYLDEHPEKRNLSADILIVEALQKIWPCDSKIKLGNIIWKLYNIENFAKKCKQNDDEACYSLAGLYKQFNINYISLYKDLCKKYKKNKNNIIANAACTKLKDEADESYLMYKFNINKKLYFFKRAKDLYSYSCNYINAGCDNYVKLLIISHNKKDFKRANQIKNKFCKQKNKNQFFYQMCLKIQQIIKDK